MSVKLILQQQYYVMGSHFHNLKICSIKLISSNNFTSENKDYIQFNDHILNKNKYYNVKKNCTISNKKELQRQKSC